MLLLFDPSARSGGKDLPITLYESGSCPLSRAGPRAARRLTRAAPSGAEMHVVNDAPVLTFVKSTYTIEARAASARRRRTRADAPRRTSPQSGEAERIAVDHVARVAEADATSSSAQRACLPRGAAADCTQA